MAEVAEAKRKAAGAVVESRDPDEFASILKQSFKPRTERAATEVENAVGTLAQQALTDSSLIKEDVLDTIEEMIARIDAKLTAQMNAILHAPEFQKIESTWRGLHYLVF
ncbi:MAG TPA: type VI secretion system contractile sheath large subunit, partial [Sphingomicrobium sp.]|nr:type VI secretion system contractile sheath large subunit [Sphingomicrobium sp.]